MRGIESDGGGRPRVKDSVWLFVALGVRAEVPDVQRKRGRQIRNVE